MAAALSAEVLQDELAVSPACALAVANAYAQEAGVDVLHSRITITQADQGNPTWRINYGHREYLRRRGDMIVDVDPTNASITQVLRGQ